MHFQVIPDAHTPYGVPRWINQMPSVLGSRKAEEFNLEFFDNGGVPPVMILLQGGTLGSETRKAIEQMSTGEAKTNNRMQILEVEPTGGSLSQTPQAKVTVERFGGDRTTDSMFEKYDERCEERVRRAFRMPPIFVGQSKDYNFATAFASYVVAEAQVFKPERDAFDEIFTMRLLPAMGHFGLGRYCSRRRERGRRGTAAAAIGRAGARPCASPSPPRGISGSLDRRCRAGA
jgi:capsid portal protein